MHTYYLIGTKKATDEYIKTLYKQKQYLLERKQFYKGCEYFKEQLKQTKIEIKDIDETIKQKIIENKLIKRMLYMEMGSWYKYYKKSR